MISIRNRPACFLCICFLIALYIYFLFIRPDTIQRENKQLVTQGYYEGSNVILSGNIISLCDKESYLGQYTEVCIKKVYCYKQGSTFRKKNLETDALLLTKPGQTVMCQFKLREKLKIGQKIYVTGELSYFKEPRNPGEFNQLHFYQRRGTLFLVKNAEVEASGKSHKIISQFLHEFKQKNEEMLTQYMEEEDAAIIKAMLFGNKNEIDNDVKELFQKNGIAHILAISGVKTELLAYRKWLKDRINTAFVGIFTE